MEHARGRMVSARIDPSSGPGDACERFLDEVGDWVRLCVRRYARAAPTDVHDQATYTTGWEPWIRRRDKTGEVGAFLAGLRDRIDRHFHQTLQWRHGYWRTRDVHHGTEHFELFLGTLWRLDPRDQATAACLIHAAEHLGNWSGGSPAWFDWDTGLFRSKFLGTDAVRLPEGLHVNTPDHLRCVNLALLAYDITQSARYRDLAAAHGGLWADAILADEPLPVAIGLSGPLYVLPEGVRYQPLTTQIRRAPGGFTALTSRVLRRVRTLMATGRQDVPIEPPAGSPEVDKAERFLASNGVGTFLQLWQLTNEPRFRLAAERLIDRLATQVGDPDAGAVAQVIRRYRAITGSTRYDRFVHEAVDALAASSFEAIAVDRASPRYTRQPGGVGKRKDMLRWLEDSQPRRHNPALLALAAELRPDDALATRAVDLARTYFILARQTFPDGRDHGCAARSVSAVARGHGRDNDTGMVTGVLAPVLASIQRSPAHAPR